MLAASLAAVILAAQANATPTPQLSASVTACKNFTTDQVEWTVYWDGNVIPEGLWVQALAEAQFGYASVDFKQSNERSGGNPVAGGHKQGSTSGTMANWQPWA